jgi:hypothetical protein
MGLRLIDLDDRIRSHMIEELDLDLGAGRLYLSPFLTDEGSERYPGLLRSAIETGTDASFALELRKPGVFRSHYMRRKPKGGTAWVAVPRTAHVTLAEGEFNRFYLRGLCLRAIALGDLRIEVYRARASAEPRSRSEALIGRTLDSTALLEDLRAGSFVDGNGLPGGPNSGLSGRIAADG